MGLAVVRADADFMRLRMVAPLMVGLVMFASGW
jgi:hypothetical protein